MFTPNTTSRRRAITSSPHITQPRVLSEHDVLMMK